MGILWWLLSEFGGYLVVGGGLVAAWFGLQWRGERKGREEATADIERANIRVRQKMAAVPKPDDAAVDEALRKGKF